MKSFIFVLSLHLFFRNAHGNQKFPSSAIVTFDPYVSIVDKDNRFRYEVGDMLPMVSMVATKFSKLFIELTEEDYTHDVLHSSRIRSIITAAIYNSHNQFSPVEIWLSFRESSTSLTLEQFNGLRNSLQSYALQASSLFQPTVTTIFFQFHHLNRFASIPTGKRNANQRTNLFDYPWLSWGWVIPASECASNLVLFRSLRPHRVLLRYPQEHLIGLGPSEIVSALKLVLDQCFKKLNARNSKSFNMGIIVSLPDTDQSGMVNMSRLVETWGELRRWSETNGTTVVLSKAFDTPYEKSVELKTGGWWRLQYNPNYKNVTEYKFERKEDIAQSFDLKENDIHLREHGINSTFMERNHTGIILSLYGDIANEGFNFFPESVYESLFRHAFNKFSKAMIVLDDDTESRKIDVANYELSVLAKNRDGFDELILMILPIVDVLPYFSRSELVGKVCDLITTYIVPCTGTGNETDEIVAYLKTNVMSNKAAGSYEIGYGLDISLCSSLPVIQEMEKEKMNETLYKSDVQKILFYFEEDEGTVKLGANRMFQQRIVMFEECKRLLGEYKKEWNYGFVMLHYATSETGHFYEDTRALADFVKYWDMLSAWALNTKTMVILGDVLDGTRVLKAKKRQVNQVGWWRNNRGQTVNDNTWTDKRTDALSKIQVYQVNNAGLARTISTTTFPTTTPSTTFSTTRLTTSSPPYFPPLNPSKVPPLTTTNFETTTTPSTTTIRTKTTPTHLTPSKSFTSPSTLSPIQSDSSINPGLIVLITTVPIILCTIISISTVILVRRYFKETVLTKDEFYEFLHGGTQEYDQGNQKGDGGNEIAEFTYKRPYDKSKYEIDSKHFSVNDTGVLGAGEFGKVCRGTIQSNNYGEIEVAVKVANSAKQHKTALKGLLCEIKILAHIGKHGNITEMIGANTSDLKQGKVYIFLELCQLGSLEKYIRKLRPSLNDNEGEGEGMNMDAKGDTGRYYNMKNMKSPQLDSSLYQNLYRWSTEICKGMAYLATKHVVHADLAARNVLLNAKKEAKICDFGLSRRMYNYANYVKTQQEPLPWKWMAPESLRLFEFNEKTDVWAFGVTLWEIYSLGDNPYPGLSYDVNFPTLLEQGLRLAKPKYDDPDDQMYCDIMQDCWKLNPAARPSFSDLMARFSNSLT